MSGSGTVTYQSLFAEPGRLWFVSATALGRTTSAMKTLAVILLVQQITGSYGLAGLVGATQTLVAAVLAPVLARLIDAHGERGVLLWSMIAHIVGVAVLIATAYSDLPNTSVLIGAAIIGGSSVQFGSLSRARWVHSLGRGRALERAYSLEAMIDELGFISGPLVVVPLCIQVHPTAGILASLTLTITGSLLLILQPVTGKSAGSTTHLSADRTRAAESVMRIPAMRLIAFAMVLGGTLFGSAEIMMVAFSEHHGQPGAASYTVAAFAVGSMVGAIAYGARNWPGSIFAKLLVSFWWLGLGTVPMLLAPGISSMTVAVFIAGLAIAPSMITANLFVEQVAPQARLTEAFAWMGSAGATGVGIGSITAGYLVDEFGVRGGQLSTVFGGISAALIITFGWKLIRTPQARD